MSGRLRRLVLVLSALALLVAVPVFVVLAPATTGLPSAQAADGPAPAAGAAASRIPLPSFGVDRSTQCVLPAARMRLEHPSLLTHQRDRAVHLGLTDEQVSMKACVGCHAGAGAGASAGSVVGHPQAFCESCHRYAAVQIDCFDCHRARPVAAR